MSRFFKIPFGKTCHPPRFSLRYSTCGITKTLGLFTEVIDCYCYLFVPFARECLLLRVVALDNAAKSTSVTSVTMPSMPVNMAGAAAPSSGRPCL